MPNQVENLGFCRNMSINADVRILPLTPPLPHVRKCPLLVDPLPPLLRTSLMYGPHHTCTVRTSVCYGVVSRERSAVRYGAGRRPRARGLCCGDFRTVHFQLVTQ